MRGTENFVANMYKSPNFIFNSNKRMTELGQKIKGWCRCKNEQTHKITKSCARGIYSEKVISYSVDKYGEETCYDCQKECK